MHRFAEAAERRDGAAMAALFAEDVTYHTPTLTVDLHGKDLTLRYLAEGTRVVDELKYTDQVSDDERLILFWTGVLGQREISGATVLAGEAGGLIENVEAYRELIDGIEGTREYLARFTPAGGLVEYWNGVIDGHLLQGIDVFKVDGNGSVTDQTAWLRPWPVVTLLRDRAIAAGLPFLTADYWRLPAAPSRLP
jgi:hypothetical protein